MEDKNNSLDLFGIKPIGDATNKVVDKGLSGIEGFLKTVCKPAFEEIGLYFADNVRSWRLKNLGRLIEKSEGKLMYSDNKLDLRINPKVALGIIDNGSLTDEEYLLELWSGLFAASCTSNDISDENVIFVEIMSKLTTAHAKILKYACDNASKIVYDDDLIVADEVLISSTELMNISGIDELYRLDRALDYLKSLDLIGGAFNSGGINIKTKLANITPKALALNLYVKCQGFNNHPKLFWDSNISFKNSEEIKVNAILTV